MSSLILELDVQKEVNLNFRQLFDENHELNKSTLIFEEMWAKVIIMK